MICEGFQMILKKQADALFALGLSAHFRVSTRVQSESRSTSGTNQNVSCQEADSSVCFRTRCCVRCGDFTCRGVDRHIATPPSGSPTLQW